MAIVNSIISSQTEGTRDLHHKKEQATLQVLINAHGSQVFIRCTDAMISAQRT